MFKDINRLIGKENGPTSIVLASVHGDEKCGIEAFKKILPKLEIGKGKVLFGYGNPGAIEENKRFVEADLNRMFKDDNLLSPDEKDSYEYMRSQSLKEYLNQADALLDVHASFTPNSRPFIICEANANGIAEYLPVNLVVSGFDRVQPGGTDYYMNHIGKVGICVECGYLGESEESAKVAQESIFAFLKARGHMTNDISPRRQSYLRVFDLYKTKTNDFALQRPFNDFEEISRGQIIGIDGDKEVRSERDSVILFARNVEKIDDEAFLLGEKKESLA